MYNPNDDKPKLLNKNLNTANHILIKVPKDLNQRIRKRGYSVIYTQWSLPPWVLQRIIIRYTKK